MIYDLGNLLIFIKFLFFINIYVKNLMFYILYVVFDYDKNVGL